MTSHDGGTEATLRRLQGVLREQGGLLAGALDGEVHAAPDDPGLGALAAAGPRSAGRRDEVAFVVEAIREGFLLHYRHSRLLRADIEPDLALLAGDHLYALGLARLAALGDVEAVAELADVISLCAQAHAQDDPDLAQAAWEAGAAAVGWGGGAALHRAKAAARRGRPGAAQALRVAGRQLSGTWRAVG